MLASDRGLIALAACLALAACTSTTSSGIRSHIRVTPATVDVGIGGVQQLAAAVVDDQGAAVGGALTFTSSDTAVARVNATGLVTGASSGATFITVSSGTLMPVGILAVIGNDMVHVSADTTLVTAAHSAQLTATVTDSAQHPTSAPVSFVSRDTTVLMVSSTGQVTETGAGTVFVVAMAGSGRDSVQITAVVARVQLAGRPFAAGMLATGSGWVTELDYQLVARINADAGNSVGGILTGVLPSSLAATQSGNRLFVGNQGGGVTVINPATNSWAGTIAGVGNVFSVAVGPGDSLLAVGTDGGKAYLVRIATLTKIDSFPVPAYTNSIAFRGDSTLLVNSQGTAKVYVINLRTRILTDSLTIGGIPQAMTVPPGGTQLYIANEIGELQIWGIANHGKLGSVALPGGGGFSMAVNPANGLFFISTSYYGQRVVVVDPATLKVVRSILTGGIVRRIAFRADGLGLAANEGGWVDIIK